MAVSLNRFRQDDSNLGRARAQLVGRDLIVFPGPGRWKKLTPQNENALDALTRLFESPRKTAEGKNEGAQLSFIKREAVRSCTN
jgi:hypothetical protein